MLDSKEQFSGEIMHLASLNPKEKTVAPFLIGLARDLREWQISRGIPISIEVGLRSGKERLLPSSARFSIGNEVGVDYGEFAEIDMGTVHLHPIPVPQSYQDVAGFVYGRMYFNGVVDSSNNVYFLVRSNLERQGGHALDLKALSGFINGNYASFLFNRFGLLRLLPGIETRRRLKIIQNFLKIVNVPARMLVGKLEDDQLTCYF